MKPIPHASNNRQASPVTDASGNVVNHGVGVTDATLLGKPMTVLFWKPTEEEVRKLQAGWVIGVAFVGQHVPNHTVATFPSGEHGAGVIVSPSGLILPH